jgi:hypothetical protein
MQMILMPSIDQDSDDDAPEAWMIWMERPYLLIFVELRGTFTVVRL